LAVRVQREDFEVGAEVRRLTAGRTDIGAVVTFSGIMRNRNDGDDIAAMTLEHYPGMTERAIEKIVEEARGRWKVMDCTVIHRYGPLEPNDQIVMVSVAGAHRGEVFAACEFIMDYLKTRAPFWKKEERAGGAAWVEARAADDEAAGRWK
jgi:molybdopterin synthase catalytic subunit